MDESPILPEDLTSSSENLNWGILSREYLIFLVWVKLEMKITLLWQSSQYLSVMPKEDEWPLRRYKISQSSSAPLLGSLKGIKFWPFLYLEMTRKIICISEKITISGSPILSIFSLTSIFQLCKRYLSWNWCFHSNFTLDFTRFSLLTFIFEFIWKSDFLPLFPSSKWREKKGSFFGFRKLLLGMPSSVFSSYGIYLPEAFWEDPTKI